jgi:hypothetical protein
MLSRGSPSAVPLCTASGSIHATHGCPWSGQLQPRAQSGQLWPLEWSALDFRVVSFEVQGKGPLNSPLGVPRQESFESVEKRRAYGNA